MDFHIALGQKSRYEFWRQKNCGVLFAGRRRSRGESVAAGRFMKRYIPMPSYPSVVAGYLMVTIRFDLNGFLNGHQRFYSWPISLMTLGRNLRESQTYSLISVSCYAKARSEVTVIGEGVAQYLRHRPIHLDISLADASALVGVYLTFRC